MQVSYTKNCITYLLGKMHGSEEKLNYSDDLGLPLRVARGKARLYLG